MKNKTTLVLSALAVGTILSSCKTEVVNPAPAPVTTQQTTTTTDVSHPYTGTTTYKKTTTTSY